MFLSKSLASLIDAVVEEPIRNRVSLEIVNIQENYMHVSRLIITIGRLLWSCLFLSLRFT